MKLRGLLLVGLLGGCGPQLVFQDAWVGPDEHSGTCSGFSGQRQLVALLTPRGPENSALTLHVDGFDIQTFSVRVSGLTAQSPRVGPSDDIREVRLAMNDGLSELSVTFVRTLTGPAGTCTQIHSGKLVPAPKY